MKKFIIMVLVGLGTIQASDNKIVHRDENISKFFDDCQKGNIDSVRSFVELHPSCIHQKCEKLLSGACRAALFGHKNVFDYLILQGALSDFVVVCDTKKEESELF